MAVFSLYIPDELLERLESLCAERDVSRSGLVRMAVGERLDDPQAEPAT